MNVYRVQVDGVMCDMGQYNVYHTVVTENAIKTCEIVKRKLHKEAKEIVLLHSDVVIDSVQNSRRSYDCR